MFEKAAEAELFALLALGIVALLLGLIGLVLKPRKTNERSWRRPVLFAALLGVIAGGSALARLPSYFWLPSGVLGLLWVGFALCRTPAFAVTGKTVVNWLGHPRLQAAVLVLGGGLLISWQSYTIGQDLERDMIDTENHMGELRFPPPLEDHATLVGLTDKGSKIQLLSVVPGADVEETAEEELNFLRKHNYDTKLIRRAIIDHNHNCHGWVFTGGKGWVRGGFVEQILHENQYQVVSEPTPGDLAIYRDHNGVPSHTAMVRAVTETGEVLLESKWGKLGRYIHGTDEHPYSLDRFAYYRSPRQGHLLRMEKR